MTRSSWLQILFSALLVSPWRLRIPKSLRPNPWALFALPLHNLHNLHPGRAAPEGHLPVCGICWLCWEKLEWAGGEGRRSSGFIAVSHHIPRVPTVVGFFCATTHTQAFCRTAGVGKGKFHATTFPPALKPPSSFLRNFSPLAARGLQGWAHWEPLCAGNQHVTVTLELPFWCNTGLVPGAHNYSAIWLFLT